MIDRFGRKITYLRLSVTDRCDLRCVYCMAEDVTFKPRAELLTLEELGRLCEAFVRKGVRKIRLTGGEPLVRRNIMSLIDRLGALVADGRLDEVTLTTNGTQLAKHADGLATAGVRRINVSLDTLDPTRFTSLTRHGRLEQVMEGIFAAKAAGLAVRINTVTLPGINDHEFDDLVAWCGLHGFDLCLIERMPMAGDSTSRHLALSQVRSDLERRWTLVDCDWQTAGPARYATIAETQCRIGFITPMSACFCDGCDRIRVTCTGALYTCLGQEDAIDLGTPLRASESDHHLERIIDSAISAKPERHGFVGDVQINRLARGMNITGG